MQDPGAGEPGWTLNGGATVVKDPPIGSPWRKIRLDALRSAVRASLRVRRAFPPASDLGSRLSFAVGEAVPTLVASDVVRVAGEVSSVLVKWTGGIGAAALSGQGARGL